MVEKAIIISTAWYDSEVEGEDVLARIELPDNSVSLACMADLDKRVIISFEEIEALCGLIQEAKQEWEKAVKKSKGEANDPQS